MAHKSIRKCFSAVAGLALVSGSAAAADHQATPAAGAAMEVVAVVEKFEPAPVSMDNYFVRGALQVDAALERELDQMLTASVDTVFERLSEKLEARSETRVAKAGDLDRSITVASSTPLLSTSERAPM